MPNPVAPATVPAVPAVPADPGGLARADAGARLLHPARAFRPPPTPALPAQSLVDIAGGLARAVAMQGDPVAGDTQRRRYVRLLGTASYEAWVIAWPTGAALELHDHGGSLGVLRVVRGSLVESFSDLLALRPLRSHRLGQNDTVVLEASRVHDVWNPDQEEAVSVHVYSPPLAAITFYDDHADRFLTPLRVEHASAP